jgi:serralysin
MGTAQGGSSNGASTALNNALVNQLDSGAFWRTSGGAVAATITFSMPTSGAFASGYNEASGWSAANAAQAAAVRTVMDLWDDLIATSITESSSANAADIKVSNTTTAVSYAHAYYPGTAGNESSLYDRIAGSVWMSGTSPSLQAPSLGTYGFTSILHEVGHALGLDHAGNYNGGSPAYGNTSTGWIYTEDSRQFTVMSYFTASSTGANWGNQNAQTPMVYDILAIQKIYGADYATRAGNTTYGFNANAGKSIYDFTQNASPVLTIWDGAGIDTIDLSGLSSA